MKFTAVLLFTALWLLIVYVPVAHWVWGGGWMAGLKNEKLQKTNREQELVKEQEQTQPTMLMLCVTIMCNFFNLFKFQLLLLVFYHFLPFQYLQFGQQSTCPTHSGQQAGAPVPL